MLSLCKRRKVRQCCLFFEEMFAPSTRHGCLDPSESPQAPPCTEPAPHVLKSWECKVRPATVLWAQASHVVVVPAYGAVSRATSMKPQFATSRIAQCFAICMSLSHETTAHVQTAVASCCTCAGDFPFEVAILSSALRTRTSLHATWSSHSLQ